MADNTILNAGTGGDTIASDDIAGVKHQRVKIEYGADGAATDVSDANPLPIDDAGGSLTIDNADLTAIAAAVAAEGAALGSGVLLQGDDGIGRKNINVDATTGDVQVDVTNTVTVDLGANNDVTVTGTVTANLGAVDNAVLDSIDAATTATQAAVEVIDNSILAEDAAFIGGSVNMAGAIRDDALTTLTPIEGDAVPLRVNSTGALHVTGGGGGTEYVQDVAATDPATAATTLLVRDDALSTQETTDGDWTVPRANARGAQWVEIDPTTPVTVDLGANNDVTATLAAETTKVIGTVNVAAAQTIAVTNAGTFATQATLQAGTNAIGKLSANSGVDIGDVDVTSIAAGANVIGDVGLSGARTSGGTTLYKNIDVDETEDQIKATAGQIYWIHAMNLSATKKYLKIYNATAATVVVGTTVPDMTLPLPTQGDTNGAGFTLSIPNGIAFGTAITIAATTGIADADSGAPGANEVVVNIGYA